MSETIRAVFEGGVFRPLEPVSLPDQSVVEFEPRPTGHEATEIEIVAIRDVPSRRFDGDGPAEVDHPIDSNLARTYEILQRRHRTGIRDLAERHNEHQP